MIGTKTGRFTSGANLRPVPIFKVGDRARLIDDPRHHRKDTITNVDHQHDRVPCVSILYDTDIDGAGRFVHACLSRGLEPLSVVDDLAGLA